MNNRVILGAGLIAALCFASASLAQDSASKKFITEAIEGNLAEVQMGQLAQKNGSSEGMKSFGQMLEKDHTEANQKAASAANSLGVTPPTEPNKQQKTMYDKMSKLNDARFDQEFAREMVADHRKDIREYEKEAKKNDAAGSYANESLPVLRKHLETAQSLTGGTAPAKASKRPAK